MSTSLSRILSLGENFRGGGKEGSSFSSLFCFIPLKRLAPASKLALLFKHDIRHGYQLKSKSRRATQSHPCIYAACNRALITCIAPESNTHSHTRARTCALFWMNTFLNTRVCVHCVCAYVVGPCACRWGPNRVSSRQPLTGARRGPNITFLAVVVVDPFRA